MHFDVAWEGSSLSGTGYSYVRVMKAGPFTQMVVFSIGDGLWFSS